jgi:hypothetical protein
MARTRRDNVSGPAANFQIRSIRACSHPEQQNKRNQKLQPFTHSIPKEIKNFSLLHIVFLLSLNQTTQKVTYDYISIGQTPKSRHLGIISQQAIRNLHHCLRLSKTTLS